MHDACEDYTVTRHHTGPRARQRTQAAAAAAAVKLGDQFIAGWAHGWRHSQRLVPGQDSSL